MKDLYLKNISLTEEKKEYKPCEVVLLKDQEREKIFAMMEHGSLIECLHNLRQTLKVK